MLRSTDLVRRLRAPGCFLSCPGVCGGGVTYERMKLLAEPPCMPELTPWLSAQAFEAVARPTVDTLPAPCTKPADLRRALRQIALATFSLRRAKVCRGRPGSSRASSPPLILDDHA